MRTFARSCALLGAGLASLAIAAAPSGATYRGANGLLVYQAQVGKHLQLFTVAANGGAQRQVTHVTGSDALNAEWSPDGQHIVFARDYAVGTKKEHLDIFTMNADGSDLHGMGLTGLNGDPTWSPDGRVLWLHGGGFAIASADGSGLQTIPVRGDNSSPVFSPDGKRIAFLRNLPKEKRALYVVNADGSHARRLMAFPHGCADKIDWSPDGSRIGFSAPANGAVKGTSTNIFTIRPNGKGLKKLTHVTGGTINAAIDSWSPDGKQIAFVDNQTDTYQIYAMNADGSGSHPITRGPESHLAAWGRHA